MTTTKKRKKITLCVDFDGVVHSYKSGFIADSIPDPPTDGAFEWLEMLLNHPDYEFIVCIYSSRSSSDRGVDQMKLWFMNNGFSRVGELHFPTQKPAAFLTIDDRAICFVGKWPSAEEIATFVPWTKAPPVNIERSLLNDFIAGGLHAIKHALEVDKDPEKAKRLTENLLRAFP